ncbi:MAG: 30S ribosomal protein S15 [Phycisphaerales bacterium]|nr:30S ribosomal protein S15 [Phycisphaerales bacterium]
MSISDTRKTEVIGEHSRHDGDTGSPEVQIAVITERIKTLQDHFATNKRDFSSRRGLLAMVSRRNRLLKFLASTDRESYLKTIQSLGLRK